MANYNFIRSVNDLTAPAPTEPFDHTYFKSFARIDASFTDDDTFIDELITAVRIHFEKTAGISIVNKSLEAVITLQNAKVEIPFGPVFSISSLKDNQNPANDITSSLVTVGDFWKYISQPYGCDMTIQYLAGFPRFSSGLPADIKHDLLRAVLYFYENRGDDQTTVKRFASQLALKYKRDIFA